MTELDYRIRPFEPTDESQVLALFRASLQWDDDERFRSLFRWKHLDGPWGPSPAWVADRDGALIGFRAMLRWQFVVDGRPIDAVRAIDTATHPDHRGRGIFRSLTMHSVEQLTGDGLGFVFNTPNDQSRPGYLKMGWRQLGRVSVQVMPARPSSALRTLRARVPAEFWSIPSDVGRPAQTGLDAEGADRVGPSVAGVMTTNRTGSYLRWRYGLDALHYRLWTVQGTAAYVVFRIRRRGEARELVVDEFGAAETLSPLERVSTLRDLLRATRCDHALMTRTVGTPRSGVPLPRTGPILTWRALTSHDPPTLASWHLSMGDIELF